MYWLHHISHLVAFPRGFFFLNSEEIKPHLEGAELQEHRGLKDSSSVSSLLLLSGGIPAIPKALPGFVSFPRTLPGLGEKGDVTEGAQTLQDRLG